MPEPTTYWDYIAVEPLLALQGELEHDESALANDEVLFITVPREIEQQMAIALPNALTGDDITRVRARVSVRRERAAG